MTAHVARPPLLGYRSVRGITEPVAEYGPRCEECGRRVRRLGPRYAGDYSDRFGHAGGIEPGTPRPERRKPARWSVAEGRTVAFDGVPLFTVDGLSDVRGLRYQPAELDKLTRRIADALNAARVDGSTVAR